MYRTKKLRSPCGRAVWRAWGCGALDRTLHSALGRGRRRPLRRQPEPVEHRRVSRRDLERSPARERTRCVVASYASMVVATPPLREYGCPVDLWRLQYTAKHTVQTGMAAGATRGNTTQAAPTGVFFSLSTPQVERREGGRPLGRAELALHTAAGWRDGIGLRGEWPRKGQ